MLAPLLLSRLADLGPSIPVLNAYSPLAKPAQAATRSPPKLRSPRFGLILAKGRTCFIYPSAVNGFTAARCAPASALSRCTFVFPTVPPASMHWSLNDGPNSKCPKADCGRQASPEGRPFSLSKEAAVWNVTASNQPTTKTQRTLHVLGTTSSLLS